MQLQDHEFTARLDRLVEARKKSTRETTTTVQKLQKTIQ